MDGYLELYKRTKFSIVDPIAQRPSMPFSDKWIKKMVRLLIG